MIILIRCSTVHDKLCTLAFNWRGGLLEARTWLFGTKLLAQTAWLSQFTSWNVILNLKAHHLNHRAVFYYIYYKLVNNIFEKKTNAVNRVDLDFRLFWETLEISLRSTLWTKKYWFQWDFWKYNLIWTLCNRQIEVLGTCMLGVYLQKYKG